MLQSQNSIPRCQQSFRPMNQETKMSRKDVFLLAVFLAIVGLCHGFDGCRNFPSSSSQGTLSMLAKPWNGIKVAYHGESVVFNCTTNDKDATVSLQHHDVGNWLDIMKPTWYFPNGSVVQTGQIFILKSIDSQEQATHYRCIAKSQQRQICLALGSIAFLANPSWVPLSIFPEKIKVVEGQNFKFICSTRSYPSSYLKLVKRTEQGYKELDSSLLERKDYDMYATWPGEISAEIKNATQSDAGTYVCMRTIPYFVRFPRKEKTINVVVEAPTRPVIKLKPSRTEITILERKTRLVRIVCKHIGGQPKPAFQWINPKGKIVHECDKYTSRCTLFIRHPVYEKDHGTYTCLASSSGGTSNQSVFLNIQVPVELERMSRFQVPTFEETPELVCRVKRANPLPVITWFYQPWSCRNKTKPQHGHVATCSPLASEWTSKFPKVSINPATDTATYESKLIAPASRRRAFYRCQASNKITGPVATPRSSRYRTGWRIDVSDTVLYRFATREMPDKKIFDDN